MNRYFSIIILLCMLLAGSRNAAGFYTNAATPAAKNEGAVLTASKTDKVQNQPWQDFSRLDGKVPIFLPPPASEPRPVSFPLEVTAPHLALKQQNEELFLYPFSEGLARASKGVFMGEGKHGFVNMAGEWVIPPELESLHFEVAGDEHFDFHNGLAAFFSEEEYGLGFIDQQGRVVIPPQPGCLSSGIFQNGLAPISTPGNIGMRYISRTGQYVRYWQAPPSARSLEYGDASEGLHIIVDPNNGKYGYMTPACEVVFWPQYKEARPFSEGLAAVKMKSGLWGYINRQGEMVIQPQFLTAGIFKNGRAPVQYPQKEDGPPPYDFDVSYRPLCYIDQKGRPITEEIYYRPVYEQAASHWIPEGTWFTNGYVAVNGEYGISMVEVLNRDGEPANFLLDCLDPTVQSFEKYFVGEYRFNENAGTLMLFENRVAKVYNNRGELLHIGSWAGLKSSNEDVALRLDGVKGIVAGRVPFGDVVGAGEISEIRLAAEGALFAFG